MYSYTEYYYTTPSTSFCSDPLTDQLCRPCFCLFDADADSSFIWVVIDAGLQPGSRRVGRLPRLPEGQQQADEQEASGAGRPPRRRRVAVAVVR